MEAYRAGEALLRAQLHLAPGHHADTVWQGTLIRTAGTAEMRRDRACCPYDGSSSLTSESLERRREEVHLRRSHRQQGTTSAAL